MFALLTKQLIRSRSPNFHSRSLLHRSIGATPWLLKDTDKGANDSVGVSRRKLNQRIHSLSVTNPPDAVEKAQAIFKQIKRPDVISYGALMAVIANSGGDDAGKRCEELCRTMEKSGIAPNYVILNSIMNAWAKAKDKNAAHRCHIILHRMKSLYDEGAEDAKPDVVSYNTVINAHAKCGLANEAEQILMEMLSDPGVEPNIISFTSVIDALAKRCTEDTAVKAQRVLDLLIAHMDRGSKSEIIPTVVSFGAVIDAWARSGARDAPEHCEDVIGRMKQMGIKPNFVAFSASITAWARSGRKNAVSKAEHYLNLMKSESREDCRPDTVTYTAVLDAMAKSKPWQDAYLEKSARLVNEMREEDAIGNSMLRPNQATFNCYLCIIARSKRVDKASMAWDIVEEMDERGVEVNDKDLNEVLAACAWSEKAPHRRRLKNFDIAVRALVRIHKCWTPDVRCYERFFQSARGLNKRKEVELTWKQCQKHGLHNVESVRKAYETAKRA